jgi:hypothetical protein
MCPTTRLPRSTILPPAIAALVITVSATTVVARELHTFAGGFDSRRSVIFEDPAPSPLRKAISPDGKLRVEGEYKKISVYEVEENRLLHEFSISDHMESPLFSADGATLFAAVSEGNLGVNSTLYSWNLETGERTRWGKCSGMVLDIGTDAKGKRLAVTTYYMNLPTFVLATREDKWIGGEIVIFDTAKPDASVRIFCELPGIPHWKQLGNELEEIPKDPESEEFKNLFNNLWQQLADANRRCLPVRVGLTPDGDKVIGVTSTGVVRVFDTETGKPELVLSSQGRVSSEVFDAGDR